MPGGLVVSFFNQINHELTENNFCLLMASPAFEVPGGTAGFEVLSSEEVTPLSAAHPPVFGCVRACACACKIEQALLFRCLCCSAAKQHLG